METLLGLFESEGSAIEAARGARSQFLASARDDFAWWIVRPAGARLARWIADSSSDKEFVLDLRSGQLIEQQ